VDILFSRNQVLLRAAILDEGLELSEIGLTVNQPMTITAKVGLI
jgi:hypothetical protein